MYKRQLLCSDGLTAGLGEDDILQALEAIGSPDEAVRALIGRAVEGGTEDNIAALVLFCDVAMLGNEAGGAGRTNKMCIRDRA